MRTWYNLWVTQTKTVRKAVIAAAGFGTRFLPQTKALPKEMLPLVDKPIIQYIVEELVDAGIQDIVIVTGYHKRAIEDHFDYISADLRATLTQGGKTELLEETNKISSLANFAYIRQKGPYGNGTPLLNAEHIIGDEPFIYTWSDDFILAKPSRFKQLIEIFEQYQCSTLCTVPVSTDSEYERYGFAGGKEIKPGLLEVETLIEKPGKAKAPSNQATNGGFIFTPDVFQYLHTAKDNLQEGSELYWNDAVKLMLEDGKKLIAYQYQNGKYYDAGNKLEYLKTVVDFALMRDELKDEFREYLRSVVQ